MMAGRISRFLPEPHSVPDTVNSGFDFACNHDCSLSIDSHRRRSWKTLSNLSKTPNRLAFFCPFPPQKKCPPAQLRRGATSSKLSKLLPRQKWLAKRVPAERMVEDPKELKRGGFQEGHASPAAAARPFRSRNLQPLPSFWLELFLKRKSIDHALVIDSGPSKKYYQ